MAGLEPVDGRGPLKRHANTEPGALIGGHFSDIDTLEHDLARGDGIAAKTHERHEQGCFSGTVGAEEDKCLPLVDAEVDPFEDFPLTDTDMQVFNLKHMASL
jgi:hypothetical protein